MLFTLLGMCAFFLRDRQKPNSTQDGQEENVDVGEPSYQVPDVLCTEELVNGDTKVDDDESQGRSLEDPVTDDEDSSDEDIYYSATDRFEPAQLSQLLDENRTIMDINSRHYEIGVLLGQGGFGAVHAATRLEDNLQVAVKIACKDHAKFVSVDRYSTPVPLEVALNIQANEPKVPQIIQLLDWQDEADRYIIVLERPMPCQSLDEFLKSNKDTMDKEDLARIIMWQTIFAVQTCCQRGVFHRDVKPENLLINPNTLEIKLIDFGCGEMLTSEGYTSFAGTEEFCPPERWINGRYYGEQTTVWSLGLLLFVILCGHFPKQRDLDKILQENIWSRDGLSQESCDFICSCLRLDPEKRIELDNLNLHSWFTIDDVQNNNITTMDINSSRDETAI